MKPKSEKQKVAEFTSGELEAELGEVESKRQIAQRMGWAENVEHWLNQEARLKKAIATQRMSKTPR